MLQSYEKIIPEKLFLFETYTRIQENLTLNMSFK